MRPVPPGRLEPSRGVTRLSIETGNGICRDGVEGEGEHERSPFTKCQLKVAFVKSWILGRPAAADQVATRQLHQLDPVDFAQSHIAPLVIPSPVGEKPLAEVLAVNLCVGCNATHTNYSEINSSIFQKKKRFR